MVQQPPRSPSLMQRSVVGLLLLFIWSCTLVGALPADAPPCRQTIRELYLRQQSISARALRKKVADASDALAEALRCHVHPPSTIEERNLAASGSAAYESYCDENVRNATRSKTSVQSSLDEFEQRTRSLVGDVRRICWTEAQRSSGSDLEAHLNFLYTTAGEVLMLQWETYQNTSVAHFVAYLEDSARTSYQQYLAFRNPERGRRWDGGSASVVSGSGGPLKTISKAVGQFLPPSFQHLCQCIGVAAGPVFVLATIGCLVVIFLPVLAGYVLIGEVVLRFWLKSMVLEGLIGAQPLTTTVLFQFVEVYAMEVAAYALVAWMAILCCVMISLPWYLLVQDMVPTIRRPRTMRP